MKTIFIEPDGSVSFLGDVCPLDLPLANPIRRRASNIRPVRFWKRMAFVLCRLVAGERGRAADWTRTWSGPWRATILATGQGAVFERRSEAVAWEIGVIEGTLCQNR